jgi:glycogen operon protein
MLLAGDEFGRTQHGNNNGYCQDNEISWVHWEHEPADEALIRFVRRVIGVRDAQPLLRRASWRDGTIVAWLNPAGGEQTDAQWQDGNARCLGLRLDRGAGETGEPTTEGASSILVLLNAHHEPVPFAVPTSTEKQGWEVLIDTARPDLAERFLAPGKLAVEPRSMLVLAASDRPEARARRRRRKA